MRFGERHHGLLRVEVGVVIAALHRCPLQEAKARGDISVNRWNGAAARLLIVAVLLSSSVKSTLPTLVPSNCFVISSIPHQTAWLRRHPPGPPLSPKPESRFDDGLVGALSRDDVQVRQQIDQPRVSDGRPA